MTMKCSPPFCCCAALLFLFGAAGTLAARPPSLSTVVLGSGNLQLSVTSQVGSTNQIESTTNLLQPVWQVLTNLVVTQSPYLFEQRMMPSDGQRFFRVVAVNGSSAGTVPPGM